MRMTKPAGVGLQLLSIPFIIYWMFVGVETGSHWTIVVGVLLLVLGGIPAAKKRDG